MAPPSLRWVFDRTHARLSACAACSPSRGRAHEAREEPAKMRWLLYWRPVATLEGHSRGSLGPGARRRRRPGGPAPAGLPKPLVMAAAASAPPALMIAARRTRTRDFCLACLNMWAYVAAYELPHDDAVAQQARVHIDYPL